MNIKLAILTVVLTVLAGAAYVAFDPGMEILTPRMAYAAETPVGQGNFTIDPAHANFYFEITHMGLSQVHGRFDKFEGHIVEDAAHLNNSSVNFTADASSIDTNVEMRDNDLRSEKYFDVAKFPQLTYQSTGVSKHGSGYILHGKLTLHGVTKPVDIPFTQHGPKVMKGKNGDTTRIGIVAEPVTLKRSDFGIGSMSPMPDGTLGLSDEVKVYISFEATLDAPAVAAPAQ